jgi:hypothetical protein
MKLTAQPHLTERREGGDQLERREPQRKHISVKARPTHGLGEPARVVSAGGGSEASGLAGPKAEWAARSVRPKVRKKNF